jgi:hypothetical protein
LSWIIEDVFSVDADRVSVTVPTTPFGIAVEFMPHTTQVKTPPPPLLQETDLPAAIAAPPAAIPMEEKSDAE